MTEETENARRAALGREGGIGAIPASLVSNEEEVPKKMLPEPYQSGDWAFAITEDGEKAGFRANEGEIVFEGDPLWFIERIQRQIGEARAENQKRVTEMEADARKARDDREAIRRERDEVKKDRDDLRKAHDRLVTEKRGKK